VSLLDLYRGVLTEASGSASPPSAPAKGGKKDPKRLAQRAKKKLDHIEQTANELKNRIDGALKGDQDELEHLSYITADFDDFIAQFDMDSTAASIADLVDVLPYDPGQATNTQTKPGGKPTRDPNEPEDF
jgi:hypothetical protein